MSRDKKDLHSELVAAYEQACDKYKQMYPDLPQPFITCTHRTNVEQESLYAKGRTAPGNKVTNARAGESPHNMLPAMAFDIAFVNLDKTISWDAKYFKFFAQCIDNPAVEWGGIWEKFKDAPHFELRSWKNLKK